MNETPTPASAPPHRHYSLATLRSIIATWGERIRFRRELEQKLKDDPHLIADIGLTQRQFEAEIAKPFWQGPMPPL
ncbi:MULTISPECIES: DUF1127 domain-containing protein [Sinorhizobium]|uniref:DUF1127 domain-containing protein n=1 Tax=Sinorhizobium TaxID=28105 RepID=UPI000BE88811|nr:MULTISPECIES: DUF1127 domain-containing protein [Sinorhizobium]PDT52789.1 hypothetical protein CO664_10525 [Sinorhizobium sp. NG07B]POH28963.1 hypothetical protein ATY30_15035 [Sinorhizobium americanum]